MGSSCLEHVFKLSTSLSLCQYCCEQTCRRLLLRLCTHPRWGCERQYSSAFRNEFAHLYGRNLRKSLSISPARLSILPLSCDSRNYSVRQLIYGATARWGRRQEGGSSQRPGDFRKAGRKQRKPLFIPPGHRTTRFSCNVVENRYQLIYWRRLSLAVSRNAPSLGLRFYARSPDRVAKASSKVQQPTTLSALQARTANSDRVNFIIHQTTSASVVGAIAFIRDGLTRLGETRWRLNGNQPSEPDEQGSFTARTSVLLGTTRAESNDSNAVSRSKQYIA